MGAKFSHKVIQYHGKTYTVLGWREWVSLPELGLKLVKAKIDTGARTSALHAFDIKHYSEDGKDKVSFCVHPLQRNNEETVNCCADLVDIRYVRDSGAHRELRYVIATTLILGGQSHTIEVTLTDRSMMNYRMLLGRKALQQCYIIDPSRSYRT